MIAIRSIKGSVLGNAADTKYSTFGNRKDRVIALSKSLDISERSCWAYIREERRVPPSVATKFISEYGEIPDDGWRDVSLRRSYEAPYRRRVAKKEEVSSEMFAEAIARQLVSAGLAEMIAARIVNIRNHMNHEPNYEDAIADILKGELYEQES